LFLPRYVAAPPYLMDEKIPPSMTIIKENRDRAPSRLPGLFRALRLSVFQRAKIVSAAAAWLSACAAHRQAPKMKIHPVRYIHSSNAMIPPNVP